MGQEALPTLGSHKGGARRCGTGLLRHRRRHGRQGCVEQCWVGWLKAITLQHSENSGHQPERRRRHLQLSPEQTLNPLHLRKGDGTPTLGPHSLCPRELRERGVHRKRGGEQRVVGHCVTTRPTGQNMGKRLGTSSQSLRTRSNLRLYLSDPGVKAEALCGSRSLWLAKPGLKPAARQTHSVHDRTRIRADLINEVSQASGRRVTNRGVTLYVTSLRLRRRTRVTTGGKEEGQTEPNLKLTARKEEPHNA